MSVVSLSDLAPGESAEVVALEAALPEAERRRLLELGLFPGTRVHAALVSPLGDPVAYSVRGMTVALRRAQAQFVRVRRVPAEEPR